jgi:biopolymer transport protein ExbD
MLDVTFQLLFFFIVSFSPADREGQIPVSLPAELGHLDKGPGDPLPADLLEFTSDLTVTVNAQLDGVNDGEISALFVRNITGREEPVDGLSGLRLRLERERTGSPRMVAVKVEADAGLRVRHLTKVMDACRQAGFNRISLAATER